MFSTSRLLADVLILVAGHFLNHLPGPSRSLNFHLRWILAVANNPAVFTEDLPVQPIGAIGDLRAIHKLTNRAIGIGFLLKSEKQVMHARGDHPFGDIADHLLVGVTEDGNLLLGHPGCVSA